MFHIESIQGFTQGVYLSRLYQYKYLFKSYILKRLQNLAFDCAIILSFVSRLYRSCVQNPVEVLRNKLNFK